MSELPIYVSLTQALPLASPSTDYFLFPENNISNRYTATCCGSLSAEWALGIGMLTITEVPEAFDSIFISPWN